MSYWEANQTALEGRIEPEDLLPPRPLQPPAFQRVCLLGGQTPSLQLKGEHGRHVTLHSTRTAWKEADTLVEQAPLSADRPLVALGMGLGYHLLRLMPRLSPEQLLVVVEQEPEVLWAALKTLDLTPVLNRPNTILAVDPDPEKVSRHLLDLLNPGNDQPVGLWGHPPSLRAANGFYQTVVTALTPAAPLARPRPVDLRKEHLRVLVFNTDYFLIPEVYQAFRHLGHEVKLVLFDKRQERGEVVIQRILQGLQEFSPDLVFTINHLGFDREGWLMDTFHRLRLPSVSWYVDSPAIILNLYAGPKSDLSYIFVWDPTYIPEVKALGFDKVFPLPLATDPDIFRLRPVRELKPWQAYVAFVGNSLMGSVEKKLERLPNTPEFLAFFARLAAAYQARPFRRLEALLADEGLTDDPLLNDLDHTQLTDLEAGIIWAATRDYRLTCLQALAPFAPVIYGDPGWRQLLGRPFQLRPEVNYFEDLPLIYGASVINFNATSLQMKTAINQRVFDAPAAGGFLLTDYREQLRELFQVGEEVICYRHPEEIPELVGYYLRHQRARQKVVERARARILAEHTYRHRLQTMLDIIRRTM